MYEQLENHEKNDSFKWWLTLIAFILVGVVLLGLITGFITPRQKVEEEKSPTSKQNQMVEASNGFATELISSEYVKIRVATPMSMSVNSTYAEQILTATVLPTTAANKAVDWSVMWGEGQSGNVTDYVTVTPLSNGSTTASVKCYQAFTGNVIVMVTTRESGCSAECIVSFVGVPSQMELVGALNEQSDGYYYVGVGGTYTYNVELSNIFGTVGTDYKDINVTFSGYGSVVLGTYEYYSQEDVSKWYDDTLTTVTLESLKDNFMSVSVNNGILSITTLKSIESYYETMTRSDGGRTRSYTNKFKEYASDDVYFYIRLEQPDSGLSKTMKIKFDGSITTDVQISETELYF